MMGLSDGRKSFPIGLAVLIQYRRVTATHPASHVAVAITLYAKASSAKRHEMYDWFNKGKESKRRLESWRPTISSKLHETAGVISDENLLTN